MSGGGVDISSFVRGLDLADARIRKALTRGVTDLMAQTLGDAQSYCPVDWGMLADSDTQEPAKVTETEISATGGFNTSYAAAVHENLTANHTNPKRRKRKGRLSTRGHNPKAQAKYLERAVREIQPKVVPHLAELCEQALKGGTT